MPRELLREYYGVPAHLNQGIFTQRPLVELSRRGSNFCISLSAGPWGAQLLGGIDDGDGAAQGLAVGAAGNHIYNIGPRLQLHQRGELS